MLTIEKKIVSARVVPESELLAAVGAVESISSVGRLSDSEVALIEEIRRSGVDPSSLRKGSSPGEEEKPRKRPPVLRGFTHKIKGSRDGKKFNFYITLGYVVSEGKPYLFEMFINTSDATMTAWTSLTARLVSALFRMAKDAGQGVDFIVKNLAGITDPFGSYFSSQFSCHMPSIAAHIGKIIEVTQANLDAEYAAAEGRPEALPDPDRWSFVKKMIDVCPSCGGVSLVREGGCSHCDACGWEGGCG